MGICCHQQVLCGSDQSCLRCGTFSKRWFKDAENCSVACQTIGVWKTTKFCLPLNSELHPFTLFWVSFMLHDMLLTLLFYPVLSLSYLVLCLDSVVPFVLSCTLLFLFILEWFFFIIIFPIYKHLYLQKWLFTLHWYPVSVKLHVITLKSSVSSNVFLTCWFVFAVLLLASRWQRLNMVNVRRAGNDVFIVIWDWRRGGCVVSQAAVFSASETTALWVQKPHI